MKLSQQLVVESFTFSQDQRSVVSPLCDVLQALGAVVQRVHGGHVGQQSLRSKVRHVTVVTIE